MDEEEVTYSVHVVMIEDTERSFLDLNHAVEQIEFVSTNHTWESAEELMEQLANFGKFVG